MIKNSMPARYRRVVVGTAAGALLLPAVASAQVRVGAPTSDLSKSFECPNAGGCSVVHESLPDRFLVASPITGVIVRWTVVGAGTFKLFPGVYQDAATDTFWRKKATTARTITGTEVRSVSFAARTPISQGDYIGLQMAKGAHVAYRFDDAVDTDFWAPALELSKPAPARLSTPTAKDKGDGRRVSFNADIEYDKDCDGIGDGTIGKDPQIGVCDPKTPPPGDADEPGQVDPMPPPQPRIVVPQITTASVRGGRLRLTLSAAATVTVRIYRANSNATVRTIIRKRPEGQSTIALGKLKAGTYRVRLRASVKGHSGPLPAPLTFKVR